MTEISYLIGTTVSSRHDLLERKMRALKNKSFLHVVPTKGRVMELEADPLFWLNRRVNTLTGVIHQIFEEGIRPEKYADYSHIDRILGQLLIKKALINRSKEPRGLAYFHSLFADDGIDRDFPGICRNISGFFSTLYQNNYEDIYANDLGGRIIWQEERDPRTADEKYALESDLLWLMGDYEELKREIKGYDDDDILKSVRDFLKEKNYASYIAGFNIIILDTLTHISRIEEEILYYLISSVEELWWLIDYDSDFDDPLAGFREACGREADRTKNTRAKEGDLESLRICYSIISLMDRLHEDGFPFRMEKALRVPYPNPYGGAIYTNRGPDMDLESGTLKIGSFPGEVDEVRAIASEIKRILFEQVADENMSPGNIRVLFPDLNDYSSIVSEIFTECGLPFSLTKGIPLSSHPLSNIFLKIFQLPIEGFRREDLFGLFSMRVIDPELLHIELPAFSPDIFPSNHYLPGDTREDLNTIFNTIISGGSTKTDIHIFDTALRRCGVDHLGLGLENLSPDKITAFMDIYSSLINNTKDIDEKIALRREYYMFLYQKMIFDRILTPFTALLTCRTPEKIVETFDLLIRLLGFPSNIININNRDIGIEPSAKRGMLKRDLRAFTLLKDLLNISHREMRLAQRLFDIEKSDILLSSFYKAFINRINDKYLLDERNPDVIRVSQWLETRGRSFEYVFAGGLTASRFPLKEEPDFIIPESSRGLFRIIDPVDYSKHLFGNLLKNYRKGLYLSFPENISEKPVQPSQVIQDLYDLIKTGARDKGSTSWSANLFYTSGNDLLNAGKNKNKEQGSSKNIPLLNLKDIIIKDHSSEEDIIRGIKAIASRSAVNGLFEYDGQVGDASEFKAFNKETSKTFSSSRLETLANCPMKYLFRYVYKIKDLDEITTKASSRDLGQFVHDILKVIFKELADIKNNIAGIGLDRAIAMAGELINACIGKRSVLEQLDFGEYYKLELFTGIYDAALPDGGMDRREGIIHALLRYENAEFINRVPEGVEFEFGTGDKPVSMGNISIKGSIDRFDRDISSPETVYIYDYKTGYIKPSANIKKGLAFQLPVYIRALESIVKPGKISAASYSLKRRSFLENSPLKNHVISAASGSGLDISGVILIDEFIKHLTGLMKKGGFHQSADGLTCEYCTFRYACHKNDRRMEYLLEISPGPDIYSGARNLARWQEADNFIKEWKTICQSMDKAKTLKTESARKRHYETVVKFYYDLERRRNSLPFTSNYLDNLMGELDRFRAGYNS